MALTFKLGVKYDETIKNHTLTHRFRSDAHVNVRPHGGQTCLAYCLTALALVEMV
jgi:hypothetical protein